MTTFSSQVILSIFFLYVVIISEKLFSLISCNFQKIIENNRGFKQLLILINIFLFTFILGWYTEQSIYSAKKTYNYEDTYENFENFENLKNLTNNTFFELYKDELIIICKYFLYSIIIYIIFIFTTKCEIKYLGMFFILIILLFLLFLIRTYSKNDYYSKSEFKIIDYINDEKKEKNLLKLKTKFENLNINDNTKIKIIEKFKINMKIQNIEFILFIISLIVLFIGFIKYYLKQKKDHKKNWSILTFFLGKNNCSYKK